MQFFPAGINDVLGSSHLYLHVSVAAMFSSKLCRAKVHLKTKRPDPTLYPSTAPLKVAAKPRMNSPLLESAQKVLEEMETVQQPPVASLPYSVSRTTVGKGLPVYIEVLKGKTLYQTRVKKVEGDAKVSLSPRSLRTSL